MAAIKMSGFQMVFSCYHVEEPGPVLDVEQFRREESIQLRVELGVLQVVVLQTKTN